MSNITCNIIRDLLPSYMDEICSMDTRSLVDGHLKSCPDCRAYADRMADYDVELPKDADIKLDYMKKIRRSMDMKGFVFFLIILTVSTVFSGYLQTGYHSVPFLLLLPALLICNYFMFSGKTAAKPPVRKPALLSIASLVFVLYMPFLMLVLVNGWISSGDYPFGLRASDMGPFTYYQLLFVMLSEIALWCAAIIVYLKTSRYYIGLSSISITGFCLALYYIQVLKTFTTAAGYLAISRVSLLILLEGLILTGVFCIRNSLRLKRQR